MDSPISQYSRISSPSPAMSAFPVLSTPSSVYEESLGSDISSIYTEGAGSDYEWRFGGEGSSSTIERASKKSLHCEFCGKDFIFQHDRLRHLRTLHHNQGSSVYRCAVPGCAKRDRMFNRLDNFKKHLRNKHGNFSPEEMVTKSRTSVADTFTVMTPREYSSSH